MAGKQPVVLRRRAKLDIYDALDFYLTEADERTASAFVKELEVAYAHLAGHPATGSPRYAYELNIEGLRCWRLKKFPYLIFYFYESGQVDVWRVLHGSRQMADWLGARDH